MIALTMKKIRINELARELEIKAHELIERLPELGVTEKKTHSSSIDEDVAIRLRRLYGFDSPDLEPDSDDGTDTAEPEVEEREYPLAAAPVEEPAEEHIAPRPEVRETAPVVSPEEPAAEAAKPAPAAPATAPIRPPLSTGRPIHPPVGDRKSVV